MDLIEDQDIGAEKSFFREKDEVSQLITFLLNNHSDTSDCEEIAELDRLHKILDCYQEQPQLLGPHLEELVFPLNQCLVGNIDLLVNTGKFGGNLQLVCKIYYYFSKVRGFKRVSKFLPHEVYQMEPCVELLKQHQVR